MFKLIYKIKNKMKKHEALQKLAILEKKTSELRKIIENCDKPRPVIERVTSFKTACEDLNIKTYGDAYRKLRLQRSLGYNESIENCEDKCLRLMIISFALNEGTESTILDKRWFPYFVGSGSGLVFFVSTFNDDGANTSSAARLAFKSEHLSNHAGKVCSEEYIDFIMN